jgi:putative sigma-54 modulation protein
MQVSVTFRNTDAEGWFKDYVHERLGKLKKYIDKPIEAHVIITVEKFRNVAEVNFLAKGINIVGKEEAKDMQMAFDSVIDKVERQIKKHKEKTRNHKENASRQASIESSVNTMDEEDDEDRPRVVETRKVILQPMSLDDAVLALDRSKNPFFIYRDISSENVTVLYRRDDGQYVLIESSR